MTEQLSLFVGPEPDVGVAGPGDIRPAPVAPALSATALALPAGIYLGASSWSFPTWRGLVYADSYDRSKLANAGLTAYAAHPLFRCAGVDRTFYAPLAVGEYERYAAQVPAQFRFLVKAPLGCVSPWLRADPGNRTVDNPHFLDPAWAQAHFVVPALTGLRGRAGPLVFQFPPLPRTMVRSPAVFAERLQAFLQELPKGPLYAVELRDEALLSEGYLQVLADAGARHCLGVHPRQPAAAEQAKLLRRLPPGPLIVRWNLHPGYAYEEARERYFPFRRLVDEDLPARVTLARLCLTAVADGHTAFVVANNKAEGSAPLTIAKLAELIVAEGGAKLRD